MSCIAEFTVRGSTLPLASALDAAPAVRLDVEQVVAADPERPTLFVWAGAGDFDAFEAGLAADDTVGTTALLEDFGDRRLYRVQVSEAAPVVLYPTGVAVGAARLDATLTADGVRVRMRFPDRSALVQYRSRCREMGLVVCVHRIYRPRRGDPAGEFESELSRKQRRVLMLAARRGYFEVPRDAALADLAAELDISPQAASERLRRGLGRLVETSLPDGPATDQ